jgi:hypothetical protein
MTLANGTIDILFQEISLEDKIAALVMLWNQSDEHAIHLQG